MAVASSEKGEVLEPTFGPLSGKNCLNNRCVYLEQLLHGMCKLEGKKIKLNNLNM